jgi:hypothetical protein
VHNSAGVGGLVIAQEIRVEKMSVLVCGVGLLVLQDIHSSGMALLFKAKVNMSGAWRDFALQSESREKTKRGAKIV